MAKLSVHSQNSYSRPTHQADTIYCAGFNDDNKDAITHHPVSGESGCPESSAVPPVSHKTSHDKRGAL